MSRWLSILGILTAIALLGGAAALGSVLEDEHGVVLEEEGRRGEAGIPPFLSEDADLPPGLEKRDGDLPPGLAKRDELPPGLAEREDGLPPGLAKRDGELPPGLDKKVDEDDSSGLTDHADLPPGLAKKGKIPPGHDK